MYLPPPLCHTLSRILVTLPPPYPGGVIFELPLSNPFEANVLDLYPIWFSDVFRRYISDLVKKINKYFQINIE